MKEQLQSISDEALSMLDKVQDMKSLEETRVMFLGKKGKLTAILKGMGALSKEERPIVGQMANDVRKRLEEAIQNAKTKLIRKRKSRENIPGGYRRNDARNFYTKREEASIDTCP